MMQRFAGAASGSLTAVDTSVHALPAGLAGVAYLRAGADNAGTVTICAASGSGGLPLAPGEWAPPIGPLQDLSQLAYVASNAGDVLNYLVLR